MKIIIGLGNPGEKYADTRHNIGFELVDKLQEEWKFPEFKFSKKFNAEISAGELSVSLRAQRGNSKINEVESGISTPSAAHRNGKLLLVKPQTFVNLSGEAVQKILEFYKILPNDILIIHDDLDIAYGKYKVATDSSSAGHNGVQNIIDTLGTQKFRRVRVGIGEEKDGAISCRIDARAFVLSKFSEEERDELNKLETFVVGEIEKNL